MSSPYTDLLTRLEGVRRVPAAQGLAQSHRAYCPSHQPPPHKRARTPSLSVAETQDGAVLLHCHAGCTVQQITSALGLAIADLFPQRQGPTDGGRPVRDWHSAAAIADQIADQALRLVLADAAGDHDERTDIVCELSQLAGAFRKHARAAMRSRR